MKLRHHAAIVSAILFVMCALSSCGAQSVAFLTLFFGISDTRTTFESLNEPYESDFLLVRPAIFATGTTTESSGRTLITKNAPPVSIRLSFERKDDSLEKIRLTSWKSISPQAKDDLLSEMTESVVYWEIQEEEFHSISSYSKGGAVEVDSNGSPFFFCDFTDVSRPLAKIKNDPDLYAGFTKPPHINRVGYSIELQEFNLDSETETIMHYEAELFFADGTKQTVADDIRFIAQTKTEEIPRLTLREFLRMAKREY